MPAVLFVCTANICRSPMAMGFLRKKIQDNHLAGEWRIESAGTWGFDGDRPAAGSQAVMSSYGLDISDHRSRRVTYQLLKEFDLILTMEHGQKEALCMEFPDFSGRIYLLSEMAGQNRDVEDPYGGAFAGYEQAAEEIEGYISDGFERILELAARATSDGELSIID